MSDGKLHSNRIISNRNELRSYIFKVRQVNEYKFNLVKWMKKKEHRKFKVNIAIYIFL